ncbi:UNVERIFIED_CONTAM: hypothetical protein KB579_03240 [Streptococcus canis]|uniref:hypothetical protein n=1 Tax=Streptococcus canis TaxID=1329 RepID=UPI0012F3E3DE|nr:hypothetical protein [Streptococcus canis]QKG74520.1 hypothetical protein GE023_009690 [Streptococcus canis]QKG75369.1 hypothetical protein GE022_003540 [Streptococcus canis]GFE46214.1 hypothetical protein ScFU6_19830 [Streptococcus canis]
MERQPDMMTNPQDDLWYGEVPLTEAERQARMKVPLYYRIWVWTCKGFKVLFKALAFLIMTPFFLLIWLRNCLILSISFPIIYVFLYLIYDSFIYSSIHHAWRSMEELEAVIFVEWKVWILIGAIITVGFFSAVYDFKDRVSDIWYF